MKDERPPKVDSHHRFLLRGIGVRVRRRMKRVKRVKEVEEGEEGAEYACFAGYQSIESLIASVECVAAECAGHRLSRSGDKTRMHTHAQSHSQAQQKTPISHDPSVAHEWGKARTRQNDEYIGEGETFRYSRWRERARERQRQRQR